MLQIANNGLITINVIVVSQNNTEIFDSTGNNNLQNLVGAVGFEPTRPLGPERLKLGHLPATSRAHTLYISNYNCPPKWDDKNNHHNR